MNDLEVRLNEYLAARYSHWPPLKRTPKMNFTVVALIIAKVLAQ